MEQPIDATLHAIWEANRLLRDEGERMAASAGQTHARRMVLQTAGSGATVPDIARRLSLQRQSIQRVADQLVEEGLACYQANPRHRRSKLLLTTPAGNEVLHSLAAIHDDWIREIGKLTPSMPWDEMRRGLETLVDALKTKSPEIQNE
ncbi:MarR family winged helix-turn-helix transcriptional regulator [Arthrobacter sp. BF1]|uniref:MarR family winged helix-turn-helix transcriptional regulator n=1 Tax=Arthrobacter sp. BF1 TaxID=2821145 RepID=UPI001C4F7B4E|nr:MarR family winged helix-turn-helix transcriptional regulator [Arthrobacter sp. BF1]